MKSISFALSAGLLTASLAACSSAPTYNTPTVAANPTVTADQLQRFAVAGPQVNAISAQYDPRIQSARPGEWQMLDGQANGEKARVVNAAGLTVVQFNYISMAVQQDPELMRQYSQMAMASSSGTGYGSGMNSGTGYGSGNVRTQ
jgi:hypothetical protein